MLAPHGQRAPSGILSEGLVSVMESFVQDLQKSGKPTRSNYCFDLSLLQG